MIVYLGVILAVLAGMLYKLRHEHKIDEIDFQTIMLPYSGFNKDAYLDYVNNIRLMTENVKHTDNSKIFLDKALENMKEISFFADFHQDEIDKHIMYVRSKGNDFILKNAIDEGNSFITT